MEDGQTLFHKTIPTTAGGPKIKKKKLTQNNSKFMPDQIILSVTFHPTVFVFV